MFGKHFASMYSGSMFGKPAIVFAVWGYVIAHARVSRRDGQAYVELNPTLLAAIFSTTPAEIVEAIATLEAPDPASRTKTSGGRRIELISEGRHFGPMQFRVINGAKYREMRDEDERREYFREKKREQRSSTMSTNVHRRPPQSTQAEAEAEATETDSRGASAPTATRKPRKPRALPPDSAHAVAEACDDWTESLGGTAPGKRIAGAWPGLLKLAPWSEVRPVWQWYLREGKASGKAEFCNPQEFAGKFDYWRQRCNGLVAAPRAPGRQIESVAEENLASLRRVLAESGQTLEGELARVGGFGLIGGQ